MKKIIICVAFLCGSWSINSANAQSVQMEGDWVINKEKSAFNGLDPNLAAPKAMLVRFSGDTILVLRAFGDSKPTEECLKLNAKDTESLIDKNTVKFSNVKLESKYKSLVFTGTYEVKGAQYTYWRKETWILRRNDLEVQRITVMPDKVDRVKAIYQKKI